MKRGGVTCPGPQKQWLGLQLRKIHLAPNTLLFLSGTCLCVSSVHDRMYEYVAYRRAHCSLRWFSPEVNTEEGIKSKSLVKEKLLRETDRQTEKENQERGKFIQTSSSRKLQAMLQRGQECNLCLEPSCPSKEARPPWSCTCKSPGKGYPGLPGTLAVCRNHSMVLKQYLK